MSHTYLPDEEPAYIEPEEDYAAQHSGDGPHHEHHHHKHEHHKHEHHEHKHHRQGDAPYTVVQGDTHHSRIVNHGDQIVGDKNQVGTVAHAIEHIMAVLMALPYQKQRHLALGHAMSRLIESEHISGAANVMQELFNSTNRYSFIPER